MALLEAGDPHLAQFDTHILWGNDVEEVHRTTGNCLSITNACMLPDVISRPIACRMP